MAARIGKIVLWMFYLAVAGCIFLLFEWARGKFAMSDSINVVCTVILTALVMVLTEVLPRKGTITRFLSRVHRCYNWMTMFLLGILPAVGVVVLHNLMKDAGGIVTWFSVFFVISEVLFISLYAAEEVFHDVLRLLSRQLCGYSLIHITEGDYPTAVACGLTCSVCWILMGFGLAELRSLHIE